METLRGTRLAEAEAMLRTGLEACDSVAAQAIQALGGRRWVPELRAALPGSRHQFRSGVILALNALDPERRYGPELIQVLHGKEKRRKTGTIVVDTTEHERIGAAMGARELRRHEVAGALLETVRIDPSYLVRVHAANSLSPG